ncbi:MAG: PD40 domain-containing protein [Betaproteobacteria bacterium]|nr:PD40 domain-containing protein [Betaproteobacteria bacterium]
MLRRYSLALWSCLATVVAAEPGYFRQPAISADAVVFVAEGDLWRASITGGSAVRLTTHPAEESNPAISPDGRWLAFSARYEGAAEVYVMPLAGGPPTRLTTEGDVARVQGWTPDGKILYATARYSDKPTQRLYTIDPTTRQSQALPLHEAAEGCFIGKSLYFTRHPLPSDNVKRYQGGLAQKIWRWDGNGEAQPLTADHPGSSRQPMCGGTRLYFLSDRDGTMNLWSMDANGRDLKQHSHHRDFDIRSASLSADGQRIVYQLGADLWVHDTRDHSERMLTLSLASDFEQTRTRWIKTPWDFVTAVEPSPNGDRVVITARGQAFVAPVGIGRRVEVTRSSEVRARQSIFSADGKSIYTFADATGEMELWRYPANGVGEAKPLTKNAAVLRLRAFPSPDNKWVAHTNKENRLFLLNLATGEERQIDKSTQGEYVSIVWSPDSRWLALVKSANNDFDALHLLDIATGKLTALTSNRYDTHSPAFSPDGKWLYYLANRNLQSAVASPWGQRTPEPYFDRQTKLYGLALDPNARWPFLPKDELQRPDTDTSTKPAAASGAGNGPGANPAATANTATKPEAKPLVLEGITERHYEAPLAAGNYSQLSTDGKRLYFIVTEGGADSKQSLRSIAIEAPNPNPPVVELFIDDIRSYRLTDDRKKIFIRKTNNELYIFDAGKSAAPAAEQAKFAVNLRDWAFSLDPREEWRNIFMDAWRMHRDYFYDKNMHGIDWPKMRAKYQPLISRATDRSEVSDIIAQMISELSTLHSQVGTPDARRGQDAIDIAALAADVEKTPQGFRITRLYNGDPELLEERGPLSRPEVNLKTGDTITAINGVACNTVMTIGELLRNQSGKQILLAVTDTAGKPREVIVTPIDTARDRALRYLTWEKERAERASKASGGRIGYVHLQAMGPADIARWAREFYPVFQSEGLILDLRHNRGGNIDSWIIEKLQRRAWHFWQSRNREQPYSNQQLAFRGFVVALIDANTYSDGETLAQGLKRLGIAPLIGVTTAGAGIFLSDQNRLRDNGLARAAESGSFVDNGRERAWITEGVGVAPDIEVDNLPFATFNGGDAQLDAAIRYLMEKMTAQPIKPPQAPPYPVLTTTSK